MLLIFQPLWQSVVTVTTYQLLPFETLEYTSTVMSRWGLTSRKWHWPATWYCINCGLSVYQCRDLFFSCWCRFSSSRRWTTAIWYLPAFHHNHISCHGCSQWWTPPLASSLPRRGSSTSLRSFVSCTGWRLQSELHSNMQSSCTSVYTGPHLHTLQTLKTPTEVNAVLYLFFVSFVRWQMSRLVSDSLV